MVWTISNLNYFLLGIIWVICIFAVAIGLDKMAKIVVWNYVLWLISLAVNSVIGIWSTQISVLQASNPNANYAQLQSFLINGKTWIILIVYLVLLVLMLNKSKITVDVSGVPLPKPALVTLMVIMTVLSILLTIAIAVWWVQIVDYGQIINIAKYFSDYPLLFNLIQYIPLILLVHGLITLYLISDFDGD